MPLFNFVGSAVTSVVPHHHPIMNHFSSSYSPSSEIKISSVHYSLSWIFPAENLGFLIKHGWKKIMGEGFLAANVEFYIL